MTTFRIVARAINKALPDARSKIGACAAVLLAKSCAPAATWIFGQAAAAGVSGESLAGLGIMGLAGAFGAMKLAEAAAGFARGAFLTPKMIAGARSLQTEAFESLARAKPETLRAPPGELAAKADCAADARAAFSYSVMTLIPAFAELAIACTFVSITATPYAAAGLLACAAAILSISLLLAPKAAAAAKRHAMASCASKARSCDLLPAFLEAKAFGAEGMAAMEFETSARAEEEALNASKKADYAIDALFLAASGAGAAATFLLAAAAVKSGASSTADFVSSVSISAMAVANVSTLGWAFRELSNCAARLSAAFEIIDAPRERLCGADPGENPDKSAPALEFKAACVGTETRIVSEASLSLPQGAKLALVGPSGAGKTTLAAAAMLFCPLTDGELRLFGTSCADANPAKWRSLLGWVPQHPKQILTTPRKYMTMSREASDSEMSETMAKLGLTLPLDESVGPGARPISGGEQQRLAMARALLSPCRILILDEPSSALDARSREALTSALLADPRAAIAITHNLEFAMRFDLIAYMESGRILACASPDEMKASCPEFMRMLEGPERSSA